MADMIVCPQCGTENPPAQKNCQQCQTPLTSNAKFNPGQSPVKMDTGELEPLLPQWLRDARESGKQEEASPEKQVPPMPEKKPAASAASSDFLAGLQTQADDADEEEVPDWLASITGATTPKQKAEGSSATEGIKWTEPSDSNAFQQDGAQNEEVPDWLAGLQSQGSVGDERDELTDFLRNTDEQQPVSSFGSSPFSTPAASDEGNASDWFSQTESDSAAQQPASLDTGSFGASNWFDQSGDSNAADAQPFTPSDTPDWLKQMSADAEAPSAQPQSSAFDMSGDTPDWLKDMSGSGVEVPSSEPQTSAFDMSGDTPDWLKDMSGSSVEVPSSEPQSSAFDMSGDTPDWLKDMSGSSVDAPSSEPQSFAFDISSDAPDWLNSLGGEASPFVESALPEFEPFASDSDSPSWLTPDVSRTIDPDGGMDEKASGDSLFSDLPDWLRSAAPESSIFDEPVTAAPDVPAVEPVQPKSGSPFESAPAFDAESLTDGGDALFTEMPDWLSEAMDSPASPATPEPITGSDVLAPNVLPSWVEAMRPVEQSQGMSLAAALSSSSGPAESQGGLMGLSGVLPAGAGFAPTGKPKAHSIKLNATEDQLKQADILEQILAAENSPVALTSARALGSSRALRWGLAFVLLAVTFAVAFMGTQIFSMPVGIPPELKTAVSIVQVIPPDAPVLVAIDYDPARAGEMEAAAAPLFDHMMILNHPRLTFISTNEYGTVLAERFITGPLAGRGYQNGITYLNLGYLSGGQMGIRAFAQDPANTLPFDIYSQPAWTLAPLQGMSALNQFAAIILITDNAEAARSWVEQTQGTRGVIPFIVVSSAQSLPMIQPYYESGQVQGMVSGLYGGAIVERQYNNGSPGMARRYWDGYSIGMLLAALLVFVGGFASLALGMRDRAAAREDK